MRSLRMQGGWLGLLALVFALVIVGLMARTALKQLGLYPGQSAQAEAGARGARPKDVLRGGEATSPNALGNVQPHEAMDRVRQLGNTVRQQAEELDERTRNAER